MVHARCDRAAVARRPGVQFNLSHRVYVCPRSPKYVGRKEPHYNYLQSYKEHYRQGARKN
jgi:hypothetical protein